MVNRRIRRRNVIDPMSVCNWLKFRIFMNCLCYLIWSILLSHVFNTLKISNMNVSVGGFLHCFWFATVIFPLPGWNRKKTLNLLICKSAGDLKVSPVFFIRCKVGVLGTVPTWFPATSAWAAAQNGVVFTIWVPYMQLCS